MAFVLILAVTLVLAPALSVPLVAESVSQLAVLLAVQASAPAPVLLNVYTWLLELNGPPTGPLAVSPEAGLTENAAVGSMVVGSLAVSLAVLL